MTPYATIALLTVASFAPATAQQATPTTTNAAQESVARKSTGFVLEKGSIEVDELVEKAAEFLGQNILFEQNLNGAGMQEIRIQKKVELDASGCVELLGALLYTRGLIIVPLDAEKGFYEVLNLAGPRAREVSMRAKAIDQTEIEAHAKRYEYVTTTVELKHINATIATNSLRPFFASSSGGGYGGTSLIVGNMGNQRFMILSGMGPQVWAAFQLLKRADQPSAEIQPDLQRRIRDLERAVQALQNGK